MNPFSDILDALNRIMGFVLAHSSDLPDELKVKIGQATAQISPVDRIVHFGKAVHEHRDGLNDIAKTVGAEAIEFAGRYGWHGLESTSTDMIADLIGLA